MAYILAVYGTTTSALVLLDDGEAFYAIIVKSGLLSYQAGKKQANNNSNKKQTSKQTDKKEEKTEHACIVYGSTSSLN